MVLTQAQRVLVHSTTQAARSRGTHLFSLYSLAASELAGEFGFGSLNRDCTQQIDQNILTKADKVRLRWHKAIDSEVAQQGQIPMR